MFGREEEKGTNPHARVRGPLAPFADAFLQELDWLGYTPRAREYKVRQMATLNRWLDSHGLRAGNLDTARVHAFLADLRTDNRRPAPVRTMRPLPDWLRAEGVIGANRVWRTTVPATAGTAALPTRTPLRGAPPHSHRQRLRLPRLQPARQSSWDAGHWFDRDA